MGTVVSVQNRRVTVFFSNKSVTRQYSTTGAPLRRIVFGKGDRLKTTGGKTIVVEDVREDGGLLYYDYGTGEIAETNVSSEIILGGPLDKMLSGQFDLNEDFRIRDRALDIRTHLYRSSVRGLQGARIDLLAHQLYIAKAVSDRQIRRVLLADEVGLGKTIEACLIMHRLLVSERIKRVLIIVPQSLTHMWFVELLRKFNLSFRIFDDDYWKATVEDGINPFQYEQLVLCDASFLCSSDIIKKAAVWAGWDMVIADEVHHAEENTPLFDLLRALSIKTENLLFLTATPQHHGDRNHFLRLQLLDPSRYPDYDTFAGETEHHKRIAAITGRLLDNKALSKEDQAGLQEFLGEDASRLEAGDSRQRAGIIAALLDRHGVGRAVFRTTRASVGGFPKRNVSIQTLQAADTVRKRVQSEALVGFAHRGQSQITFAGDPRISFMAELLRVHPEKKFLLICSDKEKVQAVERALAQHISVKTAQFHEGLTLIQRDRNAAWFAEEEGARILLCSEIGSEGRNFQFVNQLILFDIPPNPELIEQRIGRLDRIGQQNEIWIHIPVVKGTAYESLTRWFHEGLGVFETVAPWAQEVFDMYRSQIMSMPQNIESTKDWDTVLANLIKATRKSVEYISEKLREGRDRLLEQHSFHPEEGEAIAREIAKQDEDNQIEDFMLSLFKQRNISPEAIRDRTYRLVTEGSMDELFPNLRTASPVVTFSRAEAIAREDIEFITGDHPVFKNTFDLLLGTNRGNCAVALLEGGSFSGLFLEAVYIVEAGASSRLPDLDRFLPPLPVRVIIDRQLQVRNSDFPAGAAFEERLKNFPLPDFIKRPEVKKIIPAMVEKAETTVKQMSDRIIDEAKREALEVLGGEVKRLERLSEINQNIQDKAIRKAKSEMVQIYDTITDVKPRLDAVRVIVAG